MTHNSLTHSLTHIHSKRNTFKQSENKHDSESKKSERRQMKTAVKRKLPMHNEMSQHGCIQCATHNSNWNTFIHTNNLCQI